MTTGGGGSSKASGYTDGDQLLVRLFLSALQNSGADAALSNSLTTTTVTPATARVTSSAAKEGASARSTSLASNPHSNSRTFRTRAGTARPAERPRCVFVFLSVAMSEG